MTRKLIIIGGGGHARVLKSILDTAKGTKILGYTDLKQNRDMGIKYLGNDDIIEKYSVKDILLVNGIGSIDLPNKRKKIYERFKSRGYTFYSIIHPGALVSSGVKLGEGVQVMAGVVINTGAVIGNNVIINTSASIDHDCKIGSHTHIAPGVTFSGNIKLGETCHIGIATSAIQGVKIGDQVLVGAGSVIINDISSGKRIFGNPAKVRKIR